MKVQAVMTGKLSYKRGFSAMRFWQRTVLKS